MENASRRSKTSVIICAKNYAQYLPRALESLRAQTRRHELIVVDDGSTDNTWEVLQDFPEARVISLPGLGLSKAANVGIRAAKGEYIVRVDADDWIDSHLIETQETYLDNNPDVDCVWCDYWEAYHHRRGDGFEVFTLNPLLQYEIEHACGAMFRKECWQALRGYDESLKYQEAFDFWQRFKRQFRINKINQAMYFYRKHDQSMSTNPERDKVRQSLKEKYGVK